MPIAVKDLIVTKGQPTTAASRMLEGWMSPYDGTVTRKVREARMPILGKTNLGEFAMGSSNEHSAFGVVRNPWALDRAPGGSGGGSAAAVTAFQAPLALGTDTGGSIRQPAALTGSVGVKPTYGSVSRYGVIAMASSLDQVGPVARTVLDTAMLHEVIAGHDPLDSTSLPDTPGNFAEEAKAGACLLYTSRFAPPAAPTTTRTHRSSQMPSTMLSTAASKSSRPSTRSSSPTTRPPRRSAAKPSKPSRPSPTWNACTPSRTSSPSRSCAPG